MNPISLPAMTPMNRRSSECDNLAGSKRSKINRTPVASQRCFHFQQCLAERYVMKGGDARDAVEALFREWVITNVGELEFDVRKLRGAFAGEANHLG